MDLRWLLDWRRGDVSADCGVSNDEKWDEQVLSKEETVSHEEASATPNRRSSEQTA
jgi:hypothetical protein